VKNRATAANILGRIPDFRAISIENREIHDGSRCYGGPTTIKTTELELGDVFRGYGDAYRQRHGASLSTARRRVMRAIERCRTAALGGHLERPLPVLRSWLLSVRWCAWEPPGLLRVHSFLETQNLVDYVLDPNRGIEHGVIERSIGPFHVEILLDESRALAIDDVHRLLSVLLACALRDQAANLRLSWRIEENPKGIVSVTEKMLRSSTDDDAVSFGRRLLNHVLSDALDTVRIEQLQTVNIQTAFEAAPQDGFKEPIVKRVDPLLAGFDLGLLAVAKPGNLTGQQLVPQFPSQALGCLSGDLGAATAIFPFYGDDVDHGIRLYRDAVAQFVRMLAGRVSGVPARSGSFAVRKTETCINQPPLRRPLPDHSFSGEMTART